MRETHTSFLNSLFTETFFEKVLILLILNDNSSHLVVILIPCKGGPTGEEGSRIPFKHICAKREISEVLRPNSGI